MLFSKIAKGKYRETKGCFYCESNGLRTQKNVDGTKTYYYYDSDKNLIGLTKGNYTLPFYYDSDGNVTSFKYGDTMYYYVKNLQGDIVKIISQSGTEVAGYVYDAWGNINSVSGEPILRELNPFRYRSYVYDTESGLYYLQSRYYDPFTGRFLNADSCFDTQTSVLGTNMFAYCDDNPINRLDQNGKWAQNLSGFKWNKKNNHNAGFSVNISKKFLSRAYCLLYAADIIRLAGKWQWWPIGWYVAGLTLTQIAAECFTHALLYYISKVTIKLFKRGYNWREAGKIINVDREDYRQWQFTAVWFAFSTVKRIPWVKMQICNILGYGIWLLL